MSTLQERTHVWSRSHCPLADFKKNQIVHSGDIVPVSPYLYAGWPGTIVVEGNETQRQFVQFFEANGEHRQDWVLSRVNKRGAAHHSDPVGEQVSC